MKGDDGEPHIFASQTRRLLHKVYNESKHGDNNATIIFNKVACLVRMPMYLH